MTSEDQNILFAKSFPALRHVYNLWTVVIIIVPSHL